MMDKLKEQPAYPLKDVVAPKNAGAYLIYPKNRTGRYAALARAGLPVYVGKANGYGGLRRRLSEHRKSIIQAENLNIEDFEVRFIVLADDDAYLACMFEAALIKRYNPFWNTELLGFGKHPVGVNREEGQISPWDTMHPGREGRGDCSSESTKTLLEARLLEKERAILKEYGLSETRQPGEAEQQATSTLTTMLKLF